MILARPNGDNIEIRFKAYMDEADFKDVVDRIKRIKDRKFHGNNGNSYWTIPISEQGYLKSLFNWKDIEWEAEIVDMPMVVRDISTDTTFIDELVHPPYPFQAIGINFLCDVKQCLLCDEMGLGKTIQVLGAGYKLHRQGKAKRVLIICPSSLKYEWESQINFFFNVSEGQVSYVIIDGSPKDRLKLYDKVQTEDILFTVINYELVLNDIDKLVEMGFDVIACDESHRIKSWTSKTSKCIKQMDAPYKWAATGTPMQNKPEELFNLLSWVNPEILGNWWKFRGTHIIIGTKFKQPNMVLGYKNLGLLHQKIAPYMIRRLKKDVAPELPEMIINNFYVSMYPDQSKLHEIINDELYDLIKEISKFTERDENGNITKKHPKADQILGMMTMLQETCNTPQLLVMSDSGMASRYSSMIKEHNRSPKIDELIMILSEFMESNRDNDMPPKAVIFTRFERMQRLILTALERANIGGIQFVNGSMNAFQKQTRIMEFKLDKGINFIVATDSMNYGANLPEASLLINVDLPYNPAVLAQRNARIHRINSTHDKVNIINLISKDGLDERILEILYTKQTMADNVVENREEEVQYLTNLTQALIKKIGKKKKKKKDNEDDGSD